MPNAASTPEVSVIVPSRNEEACLAECLRTLVGQTGPSYEIIIVDDHSTDGTRVIAESFCLPTLSPNIGEKGGAPMLRVITADPLPPGWSGKCNAAWSGAKIAEGKWLLFTDADTRHAADSVARGLQEANEWSADLLSYSPKQEVHGFAERALMPVIFAELAMMYPPKEVCDPNSPVAAANGQYLLVRRGVYDAAGGHAAVALAILEDVELAKQVKQAGYRLRFHLSDVVSARMYRSFPQMWEGWTKNLALLFPNPRGLALRRSVEFAMIVVGAGWAIASFAQGEKLSGALAAVVTLDFVYLFWKRIWRAHFDRLSNVLAVFGLPLFAILLLNSHISHKRASVRWKGREYSGPGVPQPQSREEISEG
jgi:glycosyltransferase involved in cell wall biosynthesis